MKIAISFGAFLPVPPAQGGATEKIWHRLAILLAAKGHEVTAFSRRWPDWPDDEHIDGVHHLRLPGRDHHSSLWKNLLLDLRWSLRVRRALPRDALVISHNVALPILLTSPFQRKRAPVTVVLGRMPKGQCRFYSRLDRLYATSHAVARAIHKEWHAPHPAPITVLGNPIDWAALQLTHPSAPRLRIGFAGRIHPEKGLRLVVEALGRLLHLPGLPPWEFVAVGPNAIPMGGAGPAFAQELRQRAHALGLARHFTIEPPCWDSEQLGAFYASCTLFAYPSIAERGETFGVAPLEAMAAGVVPIVSALDCFGDFIQHGRNGTVFDHRSPRASELLADAFASLLRDPARRISLATAARVTARRFDYASVVAQLEADLATLI